MVQRIINLPKNHSFFLFGPRQTGKTTLIKELCGSDKILRFNLLLQEEFVRLLTDPGLLRREILNRDRSIKHVFIDEIQRIPELLNDVHSLIEEDKNLSFYLSGSSARKLKKQKANLLAGRAWTFHLYPLTHQEIGESFFLEKALRFGTLPSVYLTKNEEESIQILKTYAETYLKEEIEQEAAVRNLPAFIRFLNLAGNENGNILNFSSLAREAGVDQTTVKQYFQILEHTLLGFFLLPFSKSFRKRLVKHPKFYFFDTGVHQALTGRLTVPLRRKTPEYGKLFEHFIILEIIRLADYKQKDYRFSFYRNLNHAEVDLIVETPLGDTYAIEIKSSDNPDVSAIRRGLKSFAEICPKAKLFCACLAPRRSQLDNIAIFPWQEVIKEIGL